MVGKLEWLRGRALPFGACLVLSMATLLAVPDPVLDAQLAVASPSITSVQTAETMGPSMGDWRRLTPEAMAKRGIGIGPAGVAVPPTDLNTTNNNSAQNETSIAVDPNNPLIVVGGFNDYNVLPSGFAGNGVTYSSDGGNTFTYLATGVPLPTGYTNSGGDPALAFDSQGRVYYACIAGSAGNTFTKSSGVFVARSDDGGANWNPLVTVAGNIYSGGSRVNFEDKEFIDVDRNPGSPYQDRVYISWTRFYEGTYPASSDSGGGDIMFSYSSDGGSSWAPPIRLSAPADLPGNGGTGTSGRSSVQGSEPEVGPDGSVYVVFKFGDYAALRRSTDGGVTFGPVRYPFGTGEATRLYDHDGINNNGTQLPSWSFRVNSFPNIETNPTAPGEVYVVASDDPTNDATGDGGNIVFVRSTDYGVNWGGVTTLNDDGGTASQVFPWMAVNDVGIVEVIWYDARNASGSSTMDVYATCSGDGGVTFSPNFRVTDQTFNPNTGQFNFNSFFGDYNGLAGGVANFHALWTDGRDGEQEIYYDRPACCDFDRNPPEVTCPADITIECKQHGGTPSNDAQLTAFFAAFTATDDCDASPSLSNDAPAVFPHGDTPVTFTAVDDSGNTATCTATVTVDDTTPPTITCPSDLTFECDSVGSFGTATATDICDPSPTVTVISRDSVPGDCAQEYELILTYQARDADSNIATCAQTITVEDNTPPEITCPDSLHIMFTSPTEAVVTFTATATDNCNASPDIECAIASGSSVGIGHHADTCVASDGCGNGDTCSFRFLLVPLDIHPQSCPNPLNVKSQSTGKPSFDVRDMIRSATASPGPVVPAAILGRADIDVRDIDVSSLKLAGVSPVSWNYEDVSAPVTDDPSEGCECTRAGADGYIDLTLKFNRDELIAALGPVTDGQELMVQISGTLLDGTPLAGGDCVVIRGSTAASLSTAAPAITGGVESYPNPFNASTVITYSLAEDADVQLEIFNILGQRVATLIDGAQPAGRHEVTWTGRSESGRELASGTYFYRLKIGEQVFSKKMVMLK